MSNATNVYDAARRRVALAKEIKSREKDGWSVIGRSGFKVTLAHAVRPPWWRMILELVFLALAGGSAFSNVERVLHVEAIAGGHLLRTTVGDVPPGWPRRPWEVPDGLAET